jgi:predicted ATPase
MHFTTGSGRDSRSIPPLVGRERELDLLRHAFQETLHGHGGLVLISGEAGIGKTALVQAFTDERGPDEALILRGYCYDLSTTPPYGLWLEMTDRYRPDGDLPQLPEVLKRGTGVGELASQAELFNVVREFLAELSINRPLLLVLEDLHWADQASLDLVRYLARQLGDDRILMVATYRDDEVTRTHPLFALLPSLIRESQATRIELGSLTPDDVTALVRARWQLSKVDEARLEEFMGQMVGHMTGATLCAAVWLGDELGLYRDENNARRRHQEARAMGFNARLEPRDEGIVAGVEEDDPHGQPYRDRAGSCSTLATPRT